jgi:hypothetical protein
MFCRGTVRVREPIPAECFGPLLAAQIGQTGGAILLHRTRTQTRTRATASDGVNDPVRGPWGQVPGTAAGSFTPSFLQ